MSKVFRPSTRESSILSKIESNKEYARKKALYALPEAMDGLSNAIASKLVEEGLIETISKNSLQEQLYKCLEILSRADDFEIDYQCAPVRNVVPNPNIISQYITVFITEKLIDHKDIIDIYGDDIDLYRCVNQQVAKFLPM